MAKADDLAAWWKTTSLSSLSTRPRARTPDLWPCQMHRSSRATGNSVTIPLVSVFDMRNGKATEERMYLNNALLMEQLGLGATG